VITGPGFKSTDLSLTKNVALGSGNKLQLRFEVFNLFNNTNFSPPNATFGNAQFGVISSAGEAREIQLGFKLAF
jgi:hypothetical protein